MSRLLVIMHGTNIVYGAGRSLITWINNSNIEYDLLYAKFPFNNESVNYLLTHLKNKPQKIMSMWLHTDQWCLYGKNDLTWRGALFTLFSNTMFCFNRLKYNRIVERYEKIYLNSLILWPLITSEDKYYLHVRELFEGKQKKYGKICHAMDKAKGIIYIDWASYNPFKQQRTYHVILNNPFDMRGVSDIDRENVLKEFNLEKGKTIYVIAGKIDEGKGIDIVIKAFMKTKIDAYLLIIGIIKGKYAEKCINMAKEDQRIIFMGEIKENNKIYVMADYILRGEKQFCIGRTIYEGLYSGDRVIIPGKAKDLDKMEDNEKFRNQVFFYEPSNINDLAHVIEETNGTQVGAQRIGGSNVDEYVRKITAFIGL